MVMARSTTRVSGESAWVYRMDSECWADWFVDGGSEMVGVFIGNTGRSGCKLIQGVGGLTPPPPPEDFPTDLDPSPLEEFLSPPEEFVDLPPDLFRARSHWTIYVS